LYDTPRKARVRARALPLRAHALSPHPHARTHPLTPSCLPASTTSPNLNRVRARAPAARTHPRTPSQKGLSGTPRRVRVHSAHTLPLRTHNHSPHPLAQTHPYAPTRQPTARAKSQRTHPHTSLREGLAFNPRRVRVHAHTLPLRTHNHSPHPLARTHPHAPTRQPTARATFQRNHPHAPHRKDLWVSRRPVRITSPTHTQTHTLALPPTLTLQFVGVRKRPRGVGGGVGRRVGEVWCLRGLPVGIQGGFACAKRAIHSLERAIYFLERAL